MAIEFFKEKTIKNIPNTFILILFLTLIHLSNKIRVGQTILYLFKCRFKILTQK